MNIERWWFSRVAFAAVLFGLSSASAAVTTNVWTHKAGASQSEKWATTSGWSDGTATFDGAVAVTLEPLVAKAKLAQGLYPLVTATSLAADVSKWTLDASALSDRRIYRLERTGESVVLHVYNTGLFMVIR